MNKLIKGRIFRDENFIVPWCNAKRLEKFVVVEDGERITSRPILIHLKAENSSWQSYFLDVCYGVWENWEGDPELDSNDHFRVVDYGVKEDLTGLTIEKIECVNCCISLIFTNGRSVVLRYINPDEFDSDCELIFL